MKHNVLTGAGGHLDARLNSFKKSVGAKAEKNVWSFCRELNEI